jgi:hypothetical protein
MYSRRKLCQAADVCVSGWTAISAPGILDGSKYTQMVRDISKILEFELSKHCYDTPGRGSVLTCQSGVRHFGSLWWIKDGRGAGIGNVLMNGGGSGQILTTRRRQEYPVAFDCPNRQDLVDYGLAEMEGTRETGHGTFITHGDRYPIEQQCCRCRSSILWSSLR